MRLSIVGSCRALRNGRRWALREPGRQYLLYWGAGAPTEIDLSQETGPLAARSVDLRTGKVADLPQRLEPAKAVQLPGLGHAPAVVWLVRQP